MKQSAESIRQGKQARKLRGNEKAQTPGEEYIRMICDLYGDVYDDREEDSRPKGLNWEPGVKAGHKSLGGFQRELEEEHGIHLSRTKLQKILITGGCWTTERSREVQRLYEEYTAPGENSGNGMNGNAEYTAPGDKGNGMTGNAAVRRIAAELGISPVSVIINLPYEKVVYGLAEKSANAVRIARCREKKKRN